MTNLKQTKLKSLKMTKTEIKIIIEENNIDIYNLLCLVKLLKLKLKMNELIIMYD